MITSSDQYVFSLFSGSTMLLHVFFSPLPFDYNEFCESHTLPNPSLLPSDLYFIHSVYFFLA